MEQRRDGAVITHGEHGTGSADGAQDVNARIKEIIVQNLSSRMDVAELGAATQLCVITQLEIGFRKK